MTDRRPALGATEVHDLWSPEVGDTFRVFVGKCGTEPQAVLVVTDGNGLFGITVDTVRMMQVPGLLPAMLVVAVGYPDADTISDTLDRRTRDLTPTHWSPYPESGGADRFLDFLRLTLFDWIDQRFGPFEAPPAYFGHSFGGLFGTWALLDDRPSFGSYVLSSPSLFLPEDHPMKPPSTYLDMVDDLRRFTDQLRSEASLDITVEVFPGQYHATVPGVCLAHGLRHLFSSR